MLLYLLAIVIIYQAEYLVARIIFYRLELVWYGRYRYSHKECLILLHTITSMIIPLICFIMFALRLYHHFKKEKEKTT